MPNPQRDLIDWLHTKQNWLQETTSRILNNDEITETDIDELTALLKTDAGQTVTDTHTFTGLGAVATPSILTLGSISDIKGIDSLAPRNPLVFGTDPLTVIYGNNGSGKSGYTRILKKATGKSNASELRYDVYKPVPTDRSCKITYKVNGTVNEDTWIVNSEPIEVLQGVDIFDAENAKLYLSKEKEVSYTPPIIALLEKLVSVAKRIGKKLDEEKSLLVNTLPTIDPRYIETQKGKLYKSINAENTEEELQSILVFSDEDKAAIKEIKERLATVDPETQAVEIRKKKGQVDRIVNQFKSAYSLVNTDAIQVLYKLKKDAVSKRSIATEAIMKNNDLSKLEGVGSGTWRALWEAARVYSVTEAYKGEDFPKVDDGKCVLCHQELDEEAQKRMLNFESFVKNTLETDAKKAETAFTEAITNLPTKPTDEILNGSLQIAGLNVDEWKPKLDELWQELETKVEELKLIDVDIEPKALEISVVIAELESMSTAMEATAKQFDEDAKVFGRVKAESELLELEAKQWTSSQNISILSEVQRLKDIQLLNTWRTLTNARSISTKASELSEQIITEDYIRRFNEELVLLSANRMKVKISKTPVRDGVVKHQIKLRDTVADIPLTDVLSEGEQRIISLAAFLADVTARDESIPFVFDDPISSLDQDFEEKTIDRLIKLSENRQVIVFTHRLSFMSIINTKATSIKPILIYRETWGAGEVGDLPFLGIKVKTSLNILKNERLLEATRVYDAEGLAKYNLLAKTICTDLRIVIEKLIETDFLSGVVERFRREVQTKNKIGNLAKIEVSDCTLIEGYMTKYSTYEHSHSPETPVDLPLPDELEEDLKVIIEWHKEFKRRMTSE